ncbi:hypothetical protein BH18ACI3_BH18ACI3_04070 [soil metagenome]
MSTMDRRSGQERRTAERFKLTLDVQWESMTGRRTGTLSDISSKGCFILSAGQVHDGEIVKIFLPFSDGTSIPLLGEVRNYVSEIGFAMRFMDLTGPQTDFLESFAAMHRQI